jgi:hypothetical protein
MLAEAKKLHRRRPCLRRQCVVFGPAEYDKKIYIPAGHVCGGNLSFLVRRSIIKKITLPAVMFAEVMCHHWSGVVS